MERVLFVDDEINILNGIKRSLRDMRDEWEMLFANDGLHALSVLNRTPVDVLVTDIRMPGMSGDQLIQQVKRDFPQTLAIALSGQCDVAQALAIYKSGVCYIPKPCAGMKLATSITEALTTHKNWLMRRAGDTLAEDLQQDSGSAKGEATRSGHLLTPAIAGIHRAPPSDVAFDLACLESSINEACLDFDAEDFAALLRGYQE